MLDHTDSVRSPANTDDDAVLRAHTIVVSTARAWDRASRNWQRNEALGRVKLICFDRVDLLGVEDNEHRATEGESSGLESGGAGVAAGLDLGGTGSESASLELVVTRMRFMGAQRTDQQPRLRILGLSSCVANGTVRCSGVVCSTVGSN